MCHKGRILHVQWVLWPRSPTRTRKTQIRLCFSCLRPTGPSPTCQMRPTHCHQPPTAHPTRPPPPNPNSHIPNTLPSSGIISYHPETKNATTGSRSLCQWSCQHPPPFHPPSTTQTRRAQPCGRALHIWDVANTLHPIHPPSTTQTCKHNPVVAFFVSGVILHPLPHLGCFPISLPSPDPDTRIVTQWSRSSCLGYPPPNPLTQTWRTWPLGCVLRVWGILWIWEHDPLGHVFCVLPFLISILFIK